MKKDIYLHNGLLFAKEYVRTVHGGRGDFIEFTKDQIIPKIISYFDNPELPDNIYYEYMTIVDKLMIIEDRSSGYGSRTIRNATADVTIAFYADGNTAGELLTLEAVNQNKKLFIAAVDNTEDECVEKILLLNKKEITLNIAGNGIYTLTRYRVTQQECDDSVLLYLSNLINKLFDKGIIVSLIRSGGQTGADESGIKAALKLNIPALIVCPKGHRLRYFHGESYDRELFESRFSSVDQKIKIYRQLRTVKYADYKVGYYYVSPTAFKKFKDPEVLF